MDVRKFLLLDDDTFIVSPISKEQLFKDDKVLMHVKISNKNIYGNNIIKRNKHETINQALINSIVTIKVKIFEHYPSKYFKQP